MATIVQPTTLNDQQRRRGIAVLMISNFFAWGGFFLIIPLIAVHYVENLGWAAGTIGLLLAIRQFAQQSLTTVFGVVCDRVGPRPLICLGMLVRAVGFASMAIADTFVLVLLSLFLAGLGGGMFESPKAAALAHLSDPESRPRLYARMGVTGGLGVTVGTQLGAILIKVDFAAVCLASTVAYLVIFLVTWFGLPSMKVSMGPVGSRAGLSMALHDRDFVSYLLILTGYWFAWTQFSLTITLAATAIAGTDSAVAWIYAVNTAITVGLGLLLPRWLERWCAPVDLLAWGTLVLSVGLAVVGFAQNTMTVLIAAAIFSVGAVIARPGQETVTANLADPAARGTYFGVAALSLAVGGGLGNLLGGIAYDAGRDHDVEFGTWLFFAAVGLAAVAGIRLNRQRFGAIRGHQQPLGASTHGENSRQGDAVPAGEHRAGLAPRPVPGSTASHRTSAANKPIT